MSAADLSDPEVIRGFRQQLAGFLANTAAAISGSDREVTRVLDWLRSDQQAHWKRQIRVREEAYQAARRVWLDAESEVRASHNSRGVERQSSIEERLAMDKARRSRDEAEERLALVRRWLIRLEQECAPLVHQCRDHDLSLRDLGGRAVRELDRLAERIDAYHAQRPGGQGV